MKRVGTGGVCKHTLPEIRCPQLACTLPNAVPPVGRPLGGWSDAYLGVIHASLEFRVAG